VKKLAAHMQVDAGKKFVNTATNLMAVEHDNIVKLLRCSSEAKKNVVQYKGRYILVDMDECVLWYEFAPNGSLRDYLSGMMRRMQCLLQDHQHFRE
jgi:hypothetical protein